MNLVLFGRGIHIAIVGTGDDGAVWRKDIHLEHGLLLVGLRLPTLIRRLGTSREQQQEQHQHAAQPSRDMSSVVCHCLFIFFSP